MSSGEPSRRQSVSLQDGGFQMMAARRMSRLGGIRGSMHASRFSFSEQSHTIKKQTKKLENTYRVEPTDGQLFKSNEVGKKAQGVLDMYLKDKTYDRRDMASLCQQLSDIIKSKVKEVDIPRHKIVVHVQIGQKNDQSVAMVSRCLWLPQYDSFATAQFENGSIFATATVYGIYFE